MLKVKLLFLILLVGIVCIGCRSRKIDLQGFGSVAPRLKVQTLSANDIDSLNLKQFGGKLGSLKLFQAGQSYLIGKAVVQPKLLAAKYDPNYLKKTEYLYSKLRVVDTSHKVYVKKVADKTVLIDDIRIGDIRNIIIEHADSNYDLRFSAIIKIRQHDSANIDRIITELISTLNIKKQYIHIK